MRIEPVIAAQMQAFRLGDQRLNQRCQHVQEQLLQADASQSFPQLFNQPYQLKAFYRLLHNPKLSSQAISRAYSRGLIKWAGQQSQSKDTYWFVFQDTTFGKYHHHSLQLGYLQLPTDNGILLHHALLTDENFVPLGLPVQHIIQRAAPEYGKGEERKKRPVEQKESAKWLLGLEWGKRFSRQTRRQLIQVADREADCTELINRAYKARQHLIIRSRGGRRIANSDYTLADWQAKCPQVHEVERPLLDGQGKAHRCRCRLAYSKVQLRGIDKPLWVVYLTQQEPIAGQEMAHWIVLTSLPVADVSTASWILDVYSRRWPTCEDFHKCLKTGCGIEHRHLHSTQALFGAIGLLSLVSIALLRLRHLALHDPDMPVSGILAEAELRVAQDLSRRYLTASDGTACQSQSMRWFVLLLARVGGHQGIRQAGLPGWQTIWRGYRQFSLLVEGYIMSKNVYSERKPPT
ncbi:IS4 family transposase [Spirosoma daeguense]